MSAVMAMLNAGLIDMAMTAAEEAILMVTSSKSLRVCGTFSGPPRVWHLFQARDPLPRSREPEARAAGAPSAPFRLGVPDCLCASMIACMLQDWNRFGWGAAPPHLVVRGSLADGLTALAQSGTLDALLWECNAAELLRARAMCVEALQPLPAPWTSHAFVCARDTLVAKSATMRRFFAFTNELCEELKTTAKAPMLRYLAEAYALSAGDAWEWLDACPGVCSANVDWLTAVRPLEYLRRLHVVDGHGEEHHKLRIAPGSRILGGPAPGCSYELGRPWAGGDTARAEGGSQQQHPWLAAGPDADEDTDEGPRPTTPAARPHLALPCGSGPASPSAAVSCQAPPCSQPQSQKCSSPSSAGPTLQGLERAPRSPRPVPAG